jgi:plasmid maintenance system antidote protein VapI
MLNENFQPNWASAPGDTIQDILIERNISLEEFAKKIHYSKEDISDLLEGRTSVTIGTARNLHTTLGGSVEFWISRDYQYKKNITKYNKTEEQWFKELPYDDMVKLGWIHSCSDTHEKINECYDFFNVDNINQWDLKYNNIIQKVAFKRTKLLESRPASVAAWIRKGEIEAEKIECYPWNKDAFKNSMYDFRLLVNTKDPSKFIPELKNKCLQCGVALVVLRTPRGCPVSGATKFLSSTKAIILLSFRFLTDDHFWFSFFHEAAHLLLHTNEKIFLEADEIPSLEIEEDEANKFAENVLIPPEYKNELYNLQLEPHEIMRFAKRINSSPGVIVGQLQHYEIIPHNRYNFLKRRYRWV